MAILLHVISFLLLFVEDVYGVYCSRSYSFSDLYCAYGCCGSYYNRYCCTYTNIPLIAGCTVGGIITLIMIIVCICACVKSGNRQGRIVGTGNVMAVTATSTSHHAGVMHHPPPYSAYPTGSGAPAYQPPGSGPAYPPTGYQQNPQGFHPAPTGFQNNPPPPPNYNDPNTQQTTYGVQK